MSYLGGKSISKVKAVKVDLGVAYKPFNGFLVQIN